MHGSSCDYSPFWSDHSLPPSLAERRQLSHYLGGWEQQPPPPHPLQLSSGPQAPAGDVLVGAWVTFIECYRSLQWWMEFYWVVNKVVGTRVTVMYLFLMKRRIIELTSYF